MTSSSEVLYKLHGAPSRVQVFTGSSSSNASTPCSIKGLRVAYGEAAAIIGQCGPQLKATHLGNLSHDPVVQVAYQASR